MTLLPSARTFVMSMPCVGLLGNPATLDARQVS